MDDRCKKSCCWTPFSCGRQRQCPCHSPLAKLIEAQKVREASTPKPAPANAIPLFQEPK